MRVGLYARVSTYDQHTLPLQIQTMQEYVQARGWSVTHSVEEVGSGARRRPRRDALLKAAKRRELDVILVWRLDRWGRSLLDLIATLEDMSTLGVGFVSLTEALDLTTPTGRAMVGMLAVFAEFEREVLRDRVKAGIAQARKEGRQLGRPQTATQHRHEVCQLHAAGISQAEIARRSPVDYRLVVLLCDACLYKKSGCIPTQ